MLKTVALWLLFFCLLTPKSYAQIGIAPVITAQPTNTSVANGATATFKVEAYSLLGMSYNWRHNGVKISNSARVSGTDGPNCVISNVGAADGGNYDVEVKNLIGSVESVDATLTLIYSPVTFSSTQMVTNGLRMQMSGPSASNYIVSASTNLKDWTPIFTNPALSGSMVFTDTTAKSRPMRFYRATAR